MHYRRIALLINLTVILTGCENDSTDDPEELSLEEQKEEIYTSPQSGDDHYLRLVERSEPVWAGISHSRHFGRIATDFVAETTDTEDLQFFVDDLIEGSQRQPGIVDMSEPYYGLQIDYEDGSSETFHLWITPEDERGVLMDTMDTHYIYTFSEEAADRVLSLIPEEQVLDSPAYADWVEGNIFGLTEIIEPYSDETLDNLIDYYDYIIRGTYTTNEPSDVPDSWGDESMAFYSFEVDQVLKGDLPDDTIEIGHPQYLIYWIRDPETGEDLGTRALDNPYNRLPEPGTDTLLFISEGSEEGEFWRFTDASIAEVQEDCTLKGTSAFYDPDYDFGDRVERFETDGSWEVELTLQTADTPLPLTDPFEGTTIEELIDRID